MFADLVVRHYFFRRQQRGWDDRPAPEIPEVADRLADRLFSPLVDEWRIGYLRPERFEEYAVAMLHALRLAIPDREGVSFE